MTPVQIACLSVKLTSPAFSDSVEHMPRAMGRPRRRWEDNIKMDLQEVGGVCGDWVEFVQDRDRWQALVSVVMNFQVP
jgi:hypothetical protein